MALTVRPPSDSRWDLVALGEVMLRLDPGDERIQSARSSGRGKVAANTTSRVG